MTLEEELLQLEERLAVRERIDELLTGDFVEIGSSGRTYDKAAALAAMAGEIRGPIRIEEFRVRSLAPDVALATYRATGALRSSLWVRRRGGWRLVFHQGTPQKNI